MVLSLVQQVRSAIIAHLRQTQNLDYSDEQIAQLIFMSRLRLTDYGLELMQSHFENCRIEIPDNELLKPSHLIFLDSVAKMPYYCGDGYLIAYDHRFCYQLQLTEGRLSILMELSSI